MTLLQHGYVPVLAKKTVFLSETLNSSASSTLMTFSLAPILHQQHGRWVTTPKYPCVKE